MQCPIKTFRTAAASLILFVTAILFAPSYFAENNATNTISPAELKALIKKLNNPFEEASSLSYLVERSISTDKGTASDSWAFFYKKPGHLRIEYFKPESRLIIKNDNYLWEYIRKNNCAMQIDISDYSPQEEADMLSSALKRVAIPGLKPGEFEGLPDEAFQQIIDGDIATITSSSRPKYILKIDTAKNILLKTEMYDKKDQLVIRSTTSQHSLISEGFWFPALIISTVKSGDSYIESNVKLSAAKAGHAIPEERFNFQKPENAVIIEK